MASSSSRTMLLSGRILFDVLLLLPIFIADMYILANYPEPFRRGYFCHDVTIRYPHKNSTVSDTALYLVGLLVPIAIIVATEVFLHINEGRASRKEEGLSGSGWEKCLTGIYFYLGIFIFGAFVTDLTTNCIKLLTGRLRPNFIDVCRSDFDCVSSTHPDMYVQNYTCTNTDKQSVTDSRLSFPSGHSSFAVYTMLYAVIYLQNRMSYSYSKLLKPILQYLLILVAIYTALTRIQDNKHHWSDVLAGTVLGIVICGLMVYILPTSLKNYHSRTEKEVQLETFKTVT